MADNVILDTGPLVAWLEWREKLIMVKYLLLILAFKFIERTKTKLYRL